jgi:hypothetical protein
VHSLLSVGVDHSLLSIREAVLQRTGARVHSAPPESALRLLQTQAFDLVVLCHSLTYSQSEEICRIVEENWTRTSILSLGHIVGSVGDQGACAIEMDWHRGPAALIQTARGLLERDAQQERPEQPRSVDGRRSRASHPGLQLQKFG